MKCVVYVSKVVVAENGATIPRGLAQIFSGARKRNAMLNVTGVLSYRNGYYLQVIEGDQVVIDKLFSKIAVDHRHENVEVILNFSTSKRFFPNWDMKLLESVNKNPDFLNFLKGAASELTLLSDHQRTLLRRFSPLNSRVEQGFKAKDLMLSAWPDFNEFNQSPVVIELCARLTRRSYSYESLRESGYFGTEQQLDKILTKFETLGILKITEPVKHVEQTVKTEKSGHFYSKMKNFLGFA